MKGTVFFLVEISKRVLVLPIFVKKLAWKKFLRIV